MSATSSATTQSTGQQWLVKAVGDTFGGILLQSEDENWYSQIVRLEGATGQESWRYISPWWLYYDWALHPDGTMYVGETPNPETYEIEMVAIDGLTGMAKLRVPMPQSRVVYYTHEAPWFEEYSDWSELGAPMIAPNGSAYVEVQSWNYLEGCAEPPCWGTATLHYDNHLQLLEVRPDGATQWQTLKEHTYDGPLTNQAVNALPWLGPGEVIPDGQGGVLAAWTHVRNVYDYYARTPEARVTRVTPSGLTDYALPLPDWVSWWWWPWNPPNRSLVLGEEGMAFGTNGVRVVSFEVGSGTVHWIWQASSGEAELVAATAGNGLVVIDGGRIVRLDSNGQATYDEWIGGAPAPIDPSRISDLQYAWGTQWIALQTSPNPGTHPVAISAAAILWPWSVWSAPSIEDTRASIGKIQVQVSKVAEAQVDDGIIRDRVNSGVRYWQDKARILLDWGGTITEVPACAPDLTDCVVDPLHSDVRDITDVVEVNLAEVLRRFPQTTKGVHILFARYLQENASGYTHPPANSAVKPNLILMRREPDDVLAHELGHVFGLPHVGLAPFNLMCGPTGVPVWDWAVTFGCGFNWFAAGLDEDTQLPIARQNASALR